MREGLVVDAQFELVAVLHDRERIPADVEREVEGTLVSVQVDGLAYKSWLSLLTSYSHRLFAHSEGSSFCPTAWRYTARWCSLCCPNQTSIGKASWTYQCNSWLAHVRKGVSYLRFDGFAYFTDFLVNRFATHFKINLIKYKPMCSFSN